MQHERRRFRSPAFQKNPTIQDAAGEVGLETYEGLASGLRKLLFVSGEALCRILVALNSKCRARPPPIQPRLRHARRDACRKSRGRRGVEVATAALMVVAKAVHSIELLAANKIIASIVAEVGR